MVSGSSKGIISQRTTSFAEAENLPALWEVPLSFADKLLPFLEGEYNAIPEKERIGKGRVYIARAAVAGLSAYFKGKTAKNAKLTPESVLRFSQQVFSYALEKKENFLRYLAIFWLAEVVKKDPKGFPICERQILAWAIDDDWEVREIVLEFVVNGIKNYPDVLLPKTREWSLSPNPNLRRLAAEGIRPRGGTKWLRDPTQNDVVLNILEQLRFDSAEYVRKSVSNNLKDLTKYMPKKILALLARWVHEAGITVTPDLASKIKSELGADHFYLIYIIKEALRWVKDRNPEFHPQIETIIGRNYLKYFDEKRNLLAREK
jgi:3-methyladenine DNA glycosylase AlkC